ncbi:MAG: outer membrane beta-barrel domain-containing protein [Deltaproteobacteria bacterium]|nr:outer membrane beta-barrel domain-containing protein [Deltaproteobacteria bacterium]
MRIPSLTLTALLTLAPAVCFAQAADPAPEGDATAPADPAPAEGGDDAPAEPEAPPADEDPPATGGDDDAKPADAAPAEKPAEQAPAVGETGTTAADYGVQSAAVAPGARLEWAERRQIRVFQKREMLKEGRHQFSIHGGLVPNDDFFAYIDTGLGYNYYFSEDISLEIRGAYTVPQKTSLEGTLTKARPDGPGLEVRLPQTLNAHVSVAATWNLLHGKLGFFGTRLTEFDLGLVFGAGAVMTEIQGKSKDQNEKKYDAQGNAGFTGLFYLSNRFALRVDFRQFFYPAEGGGVSFPISTTVGLSYFTAPLE